MNIEQERELIDKYKNLDSKFVFNKLKSQDAFLFFNSKTIKPSIEILKEQILREKYFLCNKT